MTENMKDKKAVRELKTNSNYKMEIPNKLLI